jgi:hypothetical protein
MWTLSSNMDIQKCLTFNFEMDIQFHLRTFNSKNHTDIHFFRLLNDLKMNVQLVQFECQSVPKLSDIHFWPKMNVSELNFFMMWLHHRDCYSDSKLLLLRLQRCEYGVDDANSG